MSRAGQVRERRLGAIALGHLDRIGLNLVVAIEIPHDYSRFVDEPRLPILLPEVPRQDLLDFFDSYTIAVIVPPQDGLFEIVGRGGGKQAAD
jgi:hypothetical protein